MNRKKLFIASCLALVATSMAFSIRADIIPALKADFGFTDTEMGIIAGTGLWGFSVTIVLGGFLIDLFGMGRLMAFAFFAHCLGVIMTIFAQGYTSLYLATLCIGLANGMVEAVINPLAATIYADNKTKYLNILHAWWPGGLIVGGLMGFALTKIMGLDAATVSIATLSLGWKIKMALILIPTAFYGYLLLGQKFPETERVTSGVTYGEMLKESLRPMFIVFLFLMACTAATELGPDQWVGNLLKNLVGIQGVLFLVYTAGIMFVLRQFCAGAIVKALTPVGVLIAASVLSCIGLFVLSGAQTALMVFVAATIFGVGKTYFWPTMLGVVAERFPKTGALGLCLMGGAGMFAAGWLMSPIMGGIQDHYAVDHIQSSLEPEAQVMVLTENGKGLDEGKIMSVEDETIMVEVDAARQISAKMTYRWVALVPAILSVIFLLIFLQVKSQGGYRAVSIKEESTTPPPAS